MLNDDAYVLMVTRRELGVGNPELGNLLMIKFFRSLEAGPEMPGQILLLNGGVHLALDDSSVLEILRRLEERGVEIQVCGTCLNFFGASERLSVGRIGTMDQTVAALAHSPRSIVL
jgi:selenium metabolism protein YedF